MWPMLVVFDHPPVGGLSDLVEIMEKVEIETFEKIEKPAGNQI